MRNIYKSTLKCFNREESGGVTLDHSGNSRRVLDQWSTVVAFPLSYPLLVGTFLILLWLVHTNFLLW